MIFDAFDHAEMQEIVDNLAAMELVTDCLFTPYTLWDNPYTTPRWIRRTMADTLQEIAIPVVRGEVIA